jgi:hypothetical protein
MILDKIEKLREKMLGYRGELDDATEKNIEIWHEQIRENQQLIDLARTPGMKILTKEVKRRLVAIDGQLTDLDTDERQMYVLVAYKKAWTDVLQTLMGAGERLRALESQIDYELE